MSEVMLPPWVRPESPETLRWIDDATVAFPPAFGRGMTQRGIWADPRWGLRRRYRGLRSDEKAAILGALNEARGQLNILRVTPHAPIRGNFATSELVSNGTFGSGTTGWSAGGASWSISVADRALRATVVSQALIIRPFGQSVTFTQYIPYVLRVFNKPGRGSMTLGGLVGSQFNTTGNYAYATLGFVPTSTGALNVGPYCEVVTGLSAGDYFEVPYISCARCALVDNSPNMLLQSDAFDNASWTKNACSITANSPNDPFGGTSADFLVENGAAAEHYVSQSATVSSAAADYCAYVFAAANNRNFLRLQMVEGTGGTVCDQFFNLATGAVGSNGTTGANWSNRRAYIVNFGTMQLCVLIARKTNSATSVTANVISGSADGTSSYTGTNGLNAINIFRAGLAQSSVPVWPGQTTTAALPSGTVQTGAALRTKGWPVSSSGLLLSSDWFEVGGELKQLTASVDSDAGGLAYQQFRPSLAGSLADNDPVIVQEPFGRFIYPGGRELTNLFGIYADCEMDLEEIYA